MPTHMQYTRHIKHLVFNWTTRDKYIKQIIIVHWIKFRKPAPFKQKRTARVHSVCSVNDLSELTFPDSAVFLTRLAPISDVT